MCPKSCERILTTISQWLSSKLKQAFTSLDAESRGVFFPSASKKKFYRMDNKRQVPGYVSFFSKKNREKSKFFENSIEKII